jgi:hypothetical protein
MARVYLETSFVSACVSYRTDVASAYQREASLAWWQSAQGRHEVLLSDAVVNELSDGRYLHREAAFAFVDGVPVLSLTPKMMALAEVLVVRRVMPRPIGGDALHVAVATVAGVEYLVTWNVRHLANPKKAQQVNAVCLEFGLVAPRILRPDDMMEIEDEPA